MGITPAFVHHLFDVEGLGEAVDGILGRAIRRNVWPTAEASSRRQRYQVTAWKRAPALSVEVELHFNYHFGFYHRILRSIFSRHS